MLTEKSGRDEQSRGVEAVAGESNAVSAEQFEKGLEIGPWVKAHTAFAKDSCLVPSTQI